MEIQFLCKKFAGDNCHKNGSDKDFLQTLKRMKLKTLINSVSKKLLTSALIDNTKKIKCQATD